MLVIHLFWGITPEASQLLVLLLCGLTAQLSRSGAGRRRYALHSRAAPSLGTRPLLVTCQDSLVGMLTAEPSRVGRVRWQMMKHLSSAAKLLRLRGTGSGSSTGYRWCVPAVHNHRDSPPWEHQGLSATLYPAQRDINNSAFSSQRENIPFPTRLSCASKQKRKQARLWLSLSRSHTSRHLPSLTSRSLYGSLISTHEDFLCVQSIVSNRGLSP